MHDDALVRAREAGPRTQLCCLTLEDERSVALGNEPVRIAGEIAGRVTSGGYGYTVGRSIAYAYVPPEHAAWGGYTGFVADLDGHLWELAYNPGWGFTPDGRIDLPA